MPNASQSGDLCVCGHLDCRHTGPFYATGLGTEQRGCDECGCAYWVRGDDGLDHAANDLKDKLRSTLAALRESIELAEWCYEYASDLVLNDERPNDMRPLGACRSCGALIRWARTLSGKSMPLDEQPAENGNVRLGSGLAVVLAGKSLEVALTTGEPLYLSHHATCPQGALWRKPVADA